MNLDWTEISKLSIGVVLAGVLVYALNLWHEDRKYTAETDRMNQEKMAAVITESLVASREDRRKLTQLSRDMMKKLRENEESEKAILKSLNEIIGLIKKDRVEQKNEIQEIIEQLEIQTRSFKKGQRK